MFRRRTPLPVGARIARWVWPPGGWRRALEFQLQKLKRLRASPHSIAAGVAVGVFASFTPFYGTHLLICAVGCLLVRGNFIAAVIGTFIGNPLTAPWFLLAGYELGITILGRETQTVIQTAPVPSIWERLGDLDWAAIGQVWHATLLPMTVGGVPLGIAAGLACYFPARRAALAYQRRRKDKIAQRAAERALMAVAKMAPPPPAAPADGA